ncbi:MAG: thiol-disulfide isomerase, partial [Bryobacteraceae bacterium]|nr:thiol-disulfide isomerase [Bryobacteraceae bacterium]
ETTDNQILSAARFTLPVLDQSKIGIIFSKEPPKERVLTLQATNSRFEIPPMADNHLVTSSFTLNAETKLVSLTPHMHVRGKAFEYRAVYPTGETEILLKVPRYDFNWQLYYYLGSQKILPKGTKIECSAWYDNSPNNPSNPDPKAAVKWGDQSWEEMMIGFFDVSFDASMKPSELFPAQRRRSDD